MKMTIENVKSLKKVSRNIDKAVTELMLVCEDLRKRDDGEYSIDNVYCKEFENEVMKKLIELSDYFSYWK